jgi:arylsulfatase A
MSRFAEPRGILVESATTGKRLNLSAPELARGRGAKNQILERHAMIERSAPTIAIACATLLLAHDASAFEFADRPNIVFILADDLGWADLGCYGGRKIHTPSIDRLAAEGIRFTQHYSGNAVCAPSRCCLMTGKHPGHAFIRNNREVQPEGQFPIPSDTVTIAKLLKAHGYATAAIGKWGLGPPGSDGDPTRQGFDLFFGYNCQRQAHNFYPRYLWRNDQQIMLDGNDAGRTGKQYSHDLMEAEALTFIRDHRAGPFFLYLPFTIPHLALQVPDDSLAEYAGQWDDPPYGGDKGYQPHETPRAAYAAMITRMDRSVGRIAELIRRLGLDERTVVFFSSDNGPAPLNVGGADSKFFESAGALRGLKGELYEGGIRTPLIARWPNTIPSGSTSDLPSAFWDLLPTLCEIAGAPVPDGIDGNSLLGVLRGAQPTKRHDFLYWEFAGYGGQQAVRMGDWKGIRTNLNNRLSKTELYDLASDSNETHDVASEHPDLVSRIERIMRDEHVVSESFPIQTIDELARTPADGAP